MESGFRIFGDELDRVESYIDVAVVGADADGNIYLEEQASGDSEQWSVPADRIDQLTSQGLAIGESDVPAPNNQMWTTLGNIAASRRDSPGAVPDDRLKQSAKELFRALIEGEKQ